MSGYVCCSFWKVSEFETSFFLYIYELKQAGGCDPRFLERSNPWTAYFSLVDLTLWSSSSYSEI